MFCDHAANMFYNNNNIKIDKNYGIVMHFSMISSSSTLSTSSTMSLCCGAESGNLFFHDFIASVSSLWSTNYNDNAFYINDDTSVSTNNNRFEGLLNQDHF